MRKLSLFYAVLLAAALAGCALLPRPLPTASEAPVISEYPAATSPADPTGQELLDAFAEVAFGSEYGGTTVGIRKWAGPVKAAVHGSPTEEDLAALKRAMDGLNAVEGFPGIALAERGQNMDIWFVPLDEMADRVPGYVKGNWGFFSVWHDGAGITSAAIAIAADVTGQAERNHLILEEVLQSAGLMQDFDRYADSIFYGPWTTVQQPAPMDWKLLRMLYLPELKQGMTPEEAMAALAGVEIPAE